MHKTECVRVHEKVSFTLLKREHLSLRRSQINIYKLYNLRVENLNKSLESTGCIKKNGVHVLCLIITEAYSTILNLF